MAAFHPRAASLTGAGEPERLRTLAVSFGFLDALASPPFWAGIFEPEGDVVDRRTV